MLDVWDLMRLGGRVAIVTGGARWIGRETAATLDVAGARVVRKPPLLAPTSWWS